MSLDPLAVPVGLAALATAALSGVFGMAGGMLLMAFLALRLDPAQAMVLHGVIQLTANGTRSVVHVRQAAWRLVPAYLLGALPVLAIALLVRFSPGRGLVLVILGAVPLVVSALPRLPLAFERRGHASACGALVMAAQLLAGASGAVLDVFFLRGTLDRREVVGTKALTQSLGHLLKLLYYGGLLAAVDGTRPIPFELFVTGPAGAVAGTALGSAVLLRLSERGFRAGSTWLVRAVSLACLLRGAAELAAPRTAEPAGAVPEARACGPSRSSGWRATRGGRTRRRSVRPGHGRRREARPAFPPEHVAVEPDRSLADHEARARMRTSRAGNCLEVAGRVLLGRPDPRRARVWSGTPRLRGPFGPRSVKRA